MRSALLRLDGVSKRFAGGAIAVADAHLDIAEGEFVTLLGPSGCGKTTTLRLIAGFEAPTEGRILLDGADITALKPFARPVNTVFQDYALFPHMRVDENVGFGLAVRGLSGAARARRVGDALARVALSDKARARVQALSGGQRQRVALARAIVCEPRMLLLDEPLSALDANLRGQMQIELKRLQRELGTTFVMVTHDQTEALAISDRIVVMNHGRIEQVAAPAELYDRPATRFVASFIGAMNLLRARVERCDAAGALLRAGALEAAAPAPWGAELAPGAAVTAGFRPEDLAVTPEARPGAAGGVVESVVFHGRSLRIHARLDDGCVVMADLPRGGGPAAVGVGDRLFLALRPGAACIVLPP